MKKYLYIIIDNNRDGKHLSYHKTQRSAYQEVANLSKIPLTRKTFNSIGDKGGWNSKHGNYFILEKELLNNTFSMEE